MKKQRFGNTVNKESKMIEVKLDKQFLKLQKELEDYWCTDANDNINEFADKVARERYFKISEIAKEIEQTCKSADFTVDKCNEISVKFSNELTEFGNYFYHPDIKVGFTKDIFEFNESKTKELMDEVKKIQMLAYCSDLQILCNKIEVRIFQTLGRITYIVNLIMEEVITPYQKLIDEEVERVEKILEDKHDEISYIEYIEITEEINKKCTKKIFNYKEMDRLAKTKGFEKVRQNGDHKIYSDGVKSIPIPQHKLGKGLSYKIQKQIGV